MPFFIHPLSGLLRWCATANMHGSSSGAMQHVRGRVVSCSLPWLATLGNLAARIAANSANSANESAVALVPRGLQRVFPILLIVDNF